MITFAVEQWHDFKREALYLFEGHWHEVAIDRDLIKLDIDYDQYAQLDASGALHVVVARSEGKVVGYWLCIIRPHLHYRTSLTAFTDVYYLDPDHRKGTAGLKLLDFVEASLKQRGVQKFISATKKHMDKGVIFRRRRHRETETVYTKVL